MFSFPINASALDFMPANPPVHPEVVYKGVNEEQWKTIDRIGDPLNCRKQVYNFQKLNRDKFFEINENDCINNKDCINEALTKYDQIFLRQGTYRIGVEGIRLKNKKDSTIILGVEIRFFFSSWERKNGGSDGTRTRDLRRDRPAF